MENTPNSDFENYLRKNLQQTDASPDDDLWAKIADKQARPNKRLKMRRYGSYAIGAVLFMVAAWGLWRQQKQSNPVEQNATQQQLLPNETNIPMANALPNTGFLSTDLAIAAAPPKSKKQAFAPNFSPRINTVPAATIRFKIENGLQYQSPTTGTSVTIPANSLVDQSGRPVTGEAELMLREYRTIGEFLASGIPMHYSDNRGPYYFNSGGMFEVRVSQEGNALNMAPDKTYDVVFSPTDELEKASLYYLDDQTGQWSFRPDAAFGQADLTQPPVASESTVINNNQLNQSSDCKPDPGMLADDPDPAVLVKIGVQTGFDLATGKITMPMWFKKNPSLTDNQLLFRMERGLIQMKKHRDQSQLFFPEDLNKFFTELAAFKNCYFTYNADSLGGTKQAKMVTTGDYWQRITVAQEEGANCIITLYDGKDGQMQFHAVLTGSTENKNFDPEKVMAEYKHLRMQRQKDFAEKNQRLRYFLYAASAFKTKEEWCLSPYYWLEYFEKNHALMARRYAALIKEGLANDDVLAANAWKNWQNTLRDQKFDLLGGAAPTVKSKNNLEYALNLNSFGIYNCDQIFRLGGEQTEFITAKYKTSSGEWIIPAFVSIMEQRTKVFFTLPSAAKLLYSPDRKIDVIITDQFGRQYHFPREKYASQKFNKTGLTVLTLNDVTDQTQSPRAWADLLEI